MQIAYTSGIKSTDISGASKRELLVEDINGDGLTDFLLGPKKNDYWIEMKKRPCGECSGCRGEIIDDPIIRIPFFLIMVVRLISIRLLNLPLRVLDPFLIR